MLAPELLNEAWKPDTSPVSVPRYTVWPAIAVPLSVTLTGIATVPECGRLYDPEEGATPLFEDVEEVVVSPATALAVAATVKEG